MKKTLSVILLLVLLAGTLIMTFNVQHARGWVGTVYIMADGSIYPPDAPVVTDDYVTYNLTGDITEGGIVVERDNIIIDGAGFNISYCYVGVDLSYRTNVTIKNLNFEHCGQGVYLESSSGINVVGNNFRVYDGDYGIYITNSQNNNIVGNTIVGDYYPGHFLEWQFGIFLKESHYNNVSSNNLTENLFTIWLKCSSHNQIVGNNITKNYEALRLWYDSNHNIISSNNISLNAWGIYVVESEENSIGENNISFNGNTGINFDGSSHNYILKNKIVGNNDGIWLYLSEHNWILENDISNNVCGITLENASSNIIYHNNFIDNELQVFDFYWTSPWVPASTNIWNNTYPSGGNYWSDYEGVDVKSGPNQDQSGSDGIGDTPYVIDENNTDYYPLMGPLGGLTREGQSVAAFPSIDVCLIFEDVTAEGLTTVTVLDAGPSPPSGFSLAGKYYKIETTASYSGTIRLRIIYDDTGMTPEEEMGLRLMQWNETLQEWVDVTTSVDIEYNQIFGETTHLSIFAVFIPTAPPPPPVDNIPPTTTLIIGDPKYIAPNDQLYVTCDTPFTLIAEDNVGGSGVYITGYRISNSTYTTGWITSQPPIVFYLTGLADGLYLIEYNSTDNAGNIEQTNTVTVTLFSWNYIFEDTYGRGTILKINLAHKFFQFITPDIDYGIRKATYMRQCGRTIIIHHRDSELCLITVAVDTKLDFCVAIAWDKQTHKQYFLIDKAGKE